MTERTRIYNVAYGDKTRLVEAPSAAAALSHVANDFFTVTVAAPRDIAHAMKSGVELETAHSKRTAPVAKAA